MYNSIYMTANIKNLEDVSLLNRREVFKLLVRGVVDTRVELAKRTGLKQATVTNIINWFIKNNIVEESGMVRGQKGRRSISIRLKSENYQFIGVRITRKAFFLSICDIQGTVKFQDQYPLDFKKGGTLAFGEIKKVIHQAIDSVQTGRVVAIGIAIPGPYLRHEGRVVFMSQFPGWENIYIEKMLETEFDIPVFVEHDAHAAAFAEWTVVEKRKMGTLLYINAGYGIGMGIIIDGKIHHGALGIAGEIGHMSINIKGEKCICGNRGCLEMYCSMTVVEEKLETWIKSKAKSTMLKPGFTFADIQEAVRAREPYPVKVIKEAAYYLGFALASILNVYNPNVIVLDGYLVNTSTQFINMISETVRFLVPQVVFENVEIRPASREINPFLAGAVELTVTSILESFAKLDKVIFSMGKMDIS
jgi:predicted NBD/HSP70 family sugar kinase